MERVCLALDCLALGCLALGLAFASASCFVVTDFDDYGPAGATGQSSSSGDAVPCPPATERCDGECVDLATRSDHCGACAHDCFGASCEGGACQPEELARGLGSVNRMTIDDTSVYFTVRGFDPCPAPDCTVGKLPKSGGAVEVLTTNVWDATGIAVDDTHVYIAAYTAGSGDGIRRVPKGGGSVETVAACNTALNLALDEHYVFYISGECGNIPPFFMRRRKADPTDVVQLTDTTPNAYPTLAPNCLATGPDDVYWVSSVAIMKAPKTMAGMSALLPAPATPRSLVRDDDGLWVVFGGDLYAVSEDGVSSEPIATRQFAFPPGTLIGIATDATYVYWPSDIDPRDGTIVKRRKTRADSDPIVIARGQAGPFIVAVDATHAYWANADGSIWRVAL